MLKADQAYGRPHLHTGIGMRRLGKHMECRDALDFRLVFRREGDALIFLFYGTHDEVKAFLKNLSEIVPLLRKEIGTVIIPD